jgi:hypothetical protein
MIDVCRTEAKVMVVMAGDEKPTFLAKPAIIRARKVGFSSPAIITITLASVSSLHTSIIFSPHSTAAAVSL